MKFKRKPIWFFHKFFFYITIFLVFIGICYPLLYNIPKQFVFGFTILSGFCISLLFAKASMEIYEIDFEKDITIRMFFKKTIKRESIKSIEVLPGKLIINERKKIVIETRSFIDSKKLEDLSIMQSIQT